MSHLSILGWFLHSAAVPPELLHLCRCFYFRYLCSTGEHADDDVYGDYDGLTSTFPPVIFPPGGNMT